MKGHWIKPANDLALTHPFALALIPATAFGAIQALVNGMMGLPEGALVITSAFFGLVTTFIVIRPCARRIEHLNEQERTL